MATSCGDFKTAVLLLLTAAAKVVRDVDELIP
jgi:hypothetical protein